MSYNWLQLVPAYKLCSFSLLAQNFFFLFLLNGTLHTQIFKSSYLSHFLSKLLQTKWKFHLFQFSKNPIEQNPQKHYQMAEPSKKRKDSTSTTSAAGQRHHDTSGDPPAPPNPSLSSPRSLTLFSSHEQRQRYYSLFSNCIILDPKYLDKNSLKGKPLILIKFFKIRS